jgi:hypothetical protein
MQQSFKDDWVLMTTDSMTEILEETDSYIHINESH